MKPDHPNVVFVLTDDQGYGDLSCHGNPVVKTPHIDALHATSVRLTDYHVGPTCAPTRAGLLTGHYANSTGVWHTIGGRSLLRSNEISMADYFNAAAMPPAFLASGIWGTTRHTVHKTAALKLSSFTAAAESARLLITGATTISMTVTGTGKGITGTRDIARTSGFRMR